MRLRRLLGRSRSRAASMLQKIDRHPDLGLVFDEAWYLARNPDVLNSSFTARDHFLTSGILEWRNPSPYVDLRFVAEALPQSGRSGPAALLFLLEKGFDRGVESSPFVDLAWYSAQHGISAEPPRQQFAHLVTHGRDRRSDPSPWLDLEWYRDQHPEIRLGGIDPFEYFLAVGRWLQRFPHPVWDESRYIALNDYVRTAIGSGKYASGFEHFCAAGHEEVAREGIALPVRIGERDDEYSESGYLTANPAASTALRRGDVRSGIEHFMTVGHRSVERSEAVLKYPSPFSTAVAEVTGTAGLGEWLVIINHFDVDEMLDPHVEIAMDNYRAAGADVVLVTTGLDADSAERVRTRATHIITKSRNDDLRDFGGWQHALRVLGESVPGSYKRIILTNDSTYFPVREPFGFFAAMRDSPADVFAATDSVSGGRYHLQSYFLGLSPSALTVLRPELARRVEEQAEGTKLSLIQRFEIGLSQYALSQGLTTQAYIELRSMPDLASIICPPDPRRLSPLAAMNLNVTHHLWRSTLDSGLPFLKVELLRDNPVEVDIDGWEAVVDGDCTADVIAAHLARVRR